MRSLIIEKKELTGLTEVSSTILAEVCGKFTSNMGIQHLFTRFRSISSDFIVNGRLVWLEISKLSLCAWNSRVFKKIAAMWGDVLFADEDESNSLAIGKCVKTIIWLPFMNRFQLILMVRRIGFMKREKEVGTHGDAKGGSSHRNTKSTGDSSIPPGFGGRKFSLIRYNGSRNSWYSKTERDGKTRSLDSNIYLRKKRIIPDMDGKEDLSRYIELGRILGYDVTMAQNHLKELLVRKGETISTKDFNEFIDDMELIDVSMGAKKFTKVSRAGNKMSRLDRFKVSEHVVDKVPKLTSVALERKCSDHCPVLLQEERNDYGPNPFQIFNSWMETEGFDKLVKNACMEYQPNEGVEYYLAVIRINLDQYVWQWKFDDEESFTVRAMLNRLPTRINLDHRGIDMDSILCPSCNTVVENSNHMFFSCNVALELWNKIAVWLDLHILEFDNMDAMFQWIDGHDKRLLEKMLISHSGDDVFDKGGETYNKDEDVDAEIRH
ncbi:RNA-directed DNA polymerase, eukaryota [Tanacetum coccineum]